MRVLVTGATGFLGGALARRLHAQGHRVTASGRDQVKGRRLSAEGIRFLEGALEDREVARALARGQEQVFHCAALSSAWGRRDDFYRANVRATQELLDASMGARVRRFVHVSSPSVCMDAHDRLGIRESDPLPEEPINDYAWSKRLAEEAVNAAVGRGLRAVILRPQAVFGPGDNALFPRLLRVAARGRFPRIGAANVVDVTYVDNVVDACLLAARARAARPGAVYNISNGDPQGLDELLDRLFKRLRLPVKRMAIPLDLAWVLAGALEGGHRLLLPDREPMLTRYSVLVLARSRTLDISKARKELGYRPRVSVATGLERFARHWEAQHGR